MKDDQLHSLLRAADRSMDPPATKSSSQLAANVRVVEQRRSARLRRVGYAAALLACYAAGLVTMKGWIERTRPEAEVVAEPIPDVLDPPIVARDADSDQAVAHREAQSTTAKLYQKNSLYQLFRQLGRDHENSGKVQIALDYYRRALDSATEEELAIAYGEDSWLLMSLKKDRQDSFISTTSST